MLSNDVVLCVMPIVWSSRCDVVSMASKCAALRSCTIASRVSFHPFSTPHFTWCASFPFTSNGETQSEHSWSVAFFLWSGPVVAADICGSSSSFVGDEMS